MSTELLRGRETSFSKQDRGHSSGEDRTLSGASGLSTTPYGKELAPLKNKRTGAALRGAALRAGCRVGFGDNGSMDALDSCEQRARPAGVAR